MSKKPLLKKDEVWLWSLRHDKGYIVYDISSKKVTARIPEYFDTSKGGYHGTFTESLERIS